MRGACAGVVQMVAAGRESPTALREILHLLRSTPHAQADSIIRIIINWADDMHFNVLD